MTTNTFKSSTHRFKVKAFQLIAIGDFIFKVLHFHIRSKFLNLNMS